ncbi:MAG: exosortase/archaeosortase family protein [Planctomycetes bacterium]|nr:exosortase/archaeosortase family protein [Planctomycetota bacterium]
MLKQCEIIVNKIAPAITKLVILFGLCLWLFWPEVTKMIASVSVYSEKAHILVVPVAIMLLIFLRRHALTKNLTDGSMWGLVILVVGLAMYAAVIWPFEFGYAHYVAIIPVLAGAILVACGWRILKLSLPMLLLLLISFPLGSRIYARLIIRPETYTIKATATALNLLPSVDTYVKGVDLIFTSKENSGVVGLGESNRGARLLFASVGIGVFVVFSQIRSFRRIIVAAMAAIPIVLFCNFLRLLCWGLIVTCTKVEPTSLIPRNIATLCSLLVLYSLFVFVCNFRFNLFVEVGDGENDIGELANE